jgi:hypothetical protein
MLSRLKSTWFLCISNSRSACSPAVESINNFRNSHPNCGLNRSRAGVLQDIHIGFTQP